MIDQLWYTWSPTGLRRTEGFQPRAASRGLMAMRGERYQALAAHLGFQLPSGVNPGRLEVESAPCSLALCDTGQDWALVHRTIIDERDTSGRPITHFTHALAGLAPDQAPDAIRLWRSGFWRADHRELPPNELELRPVELERIEPGPLTPDTLRAALREPALTAALSWLVQGFCETPADKPIVVLATPDEVAALIYGLTLALPREVLRGLTFNTWVPAQQLAFSFSAARIIGSCGWSGTGASLQRSVSLPPALGGRALVLDRFAPRSSWPRLPVGSPAAGFAHFAAVDCLATGDSDRLERLRRLAEEHRVDRIDAFLDLFRLLHDGVCPDDIPAIATRASLAVTLLPETHVQQLLVQGVAQAADWWPHPVQSALRERRAEPMLQPALDDIARQAVAEAALAASQGQAPYDAAERLLTLARDLGDKRSVATALFDAVERALGPGPPNWTLRRWLIGEVAPAQASLPLDRLRRWLDVDGEQARQLLGPDLPPAWRRLLAANLIRGTAAGGRLSGDSLAAWETDLRPALADLIAERASPTAARFLSAVRERDSVVFRRLLAELLAGEALDFNAAAELLASLALSRAELAELLLGRNARGRPGWAAVIAAWLPGLRWAELLGGQSLPLDTLAEDARLAPRDTQDLLRSWARAERFLMAPAMEREALARFVADLNALPWSEPDLNPLLSRLLGALAGTVLSVSELALATELLAPLFWEDSWQLPLSLLQVERGLSPERARLYRDLALRHDAPAAVREQMERAGVSFPRSEPPAPPEPVPPPEAPEPEPGLVVAPLAPDARALLEDRLWTGINTAERHPDYLPLGVFQQDLAAYLDGTPLWTDDGPRIELLRDVLRASAGNGDGRAGDRPAIALEASLRRSVADRLVLIESLASPPRQRRELRAFCEALARHALPQPEAARAALAARVMGTLTDHLRLTADARDAVQLLADTLQLDRWSLLLNWLSETIPARQRQATVALLGCAMEMLGDEREAASDDVRQELRSAVRTLDWRTARTLRRHVEQWSSRRQAAWRQLQAGSDPARSGRVRGLGHHLPPTR